MCPINAAASSSLQPSALDPQPSTPNPEPGALNPKPHNLNPYNPPQIPPCPYMECILVLAPFNTVLQSRLGAIDTRSLASCRVFWGLLMWRARALFRSKIDGY